MLLHIDEGGIVASLMRALPSLIPSHSQDNTQEPGHVFHQSIGSIEAACVLTSRLAWHRERIRDLAVTSASTSICISLPSNPSASAVVHGSDEDTRRCMASAGEDDTIVLQLVSMNSRMRNQPDRQLHTWCKALRDLISSPPADGANTRTGAVQQLHGAGVSPTLLIDIINVAEALRREVSRAAAGGAAAHLNLSPAARIQKISGERHLSWEEHTENFGLYVCLTHSYYSPFTNASVSQTYLSFILLQELNRPSECLAHLRWTWSTAASSHQSSLRFSARVTPASSDGWI